MSNPSRRTRLGLVLGASLLLAACGGGSFEEDPADGPAAPVSPEGPVELQMLIASSGDAETNAVNEAVNGWADETGNTVRVTVASDMNQQLAQGFASGNPADVFYMDAGRFADYASNGSLYAYADQLGDNDDFYESLRDAFTYDGTQYCAPKDFSALALIINTGSWEAAGLGEDDIPTTWDELAAVSETLTTGNQAGLGIGIGIDRLGAFVVQNGGWWLNDDATEPNAGTPEVEEALTFVQEQVRAGNFQMSNQLDSGWGGEAFGSGRAAMTLEGNWIKGAMANDYPDVDYIVAELPEGPAGPGTLTFTQCWGIAADSQAQAQAVELVEYLTSVEQQLAFADAFGVMPSRASAAGGYEEQFPEDAAFIAGGEYGHGPINAPGMEQVIADLNSKLEDFGGANIPNVLQEFDSNAASVLGR